MSENSDKGLKETLQYVVEVSTPAEGVLKPGEHGMVEIGDKEYYVSTNGEVQTASDRAEAEKLAADRHVVRQQRKMTLHPDTIEVHSLAGLVDYIGAFPESEPAAITVGHDHVELISPERLDGARDVYAKAIALPCGFSFDTWYAQAEVLPALMGCFAETPDRTRLLKLFREGVKLEAVTEITDDGINQQTQSRSGLFAVMENVSPFVDLRPFRTFPEIEQPKSTFAFRMAKDIDGNGGVKVKILEADGGRWMNVAITAIRGELKSLLESSNIEMPILA